MVLETSFDIDSIISSNKHNITLQETESYNKCSFEVYVGLSVLAILFLPLNICALWHCRTSLTTQKNCSFSNVLNFNIIIASLVLCTPPIILFIFSLHPTEWLLYIIGNILTNAFLHAQTQFHTCICVEQYVAVVHPIFYLRIKQFRYRAVLVSLTWIISLIFGMIEVHFHKFGIYVFLIHIIGLFLLILFCSVVTLTTLWQSSPGGGQISEMHLKKLKAFKIITLTLVVVIIRFCPHICVTIWSQYLPLKTLCVYGSVSLSLLQFGSIFHSLVYLFRLIKKPCFFSV